MNQAKDCGKLRIFPLAFLSILLIAAAGCGSGSGSGVGAAADGSEKSGSPAVASSAPGKVKALKQGVDMDRYGLVYQSDGSGTAYSIDGTMYLSLKDIQALSKTAAVYDPAGRTVVFGDDTRPSTDFYMPNLAQYPQLDNGNGLFNLHWRSDGVTDFSFSSRDSSFQSMARSAAQKLKSDGFTAATKQQYQELANSLSEFGRGDRQNTYVKSESNQKLSAIQLIDGGTESGKIPVMITRMKAEAGYPAKNWTENPADVVTDAPASSGKTAQGTQAEAVGTKVAVTYYGLRAKTDAYTVDGNLCMSLDDVSRLFRTRMEYDPSTRSISFGACLRAKIEILFNLSDYPNLEDAIGSPPSEILSEDTIVSVFRFPVKNGSSEDIMRKITAKLKTDGFAAATEQQFAAIEKTQGTGAFRQGGRKNTYFKNNRVPYGNGESSSDSYPCIIQIFSEGSGGTVTVKMLDSYIQL